MKVSKDKVVSIHYTLTDSNGEKIDSSRGGADPLVYLHGHKNLISGMEKNLEGREVGDTFEVVITSAEGYGPIREELVQEAPRDAFPNDMDIEVGMKFHAEDDNGHQHLVQIKEITETHVVVDGNHPLAGMDLNFSVDVVDIRDAQEEELAHGHVHGHGGHHH